MAFLTTRCSRPEQRADWAGWRRPSSQLSSLPPHKNNWSCFTDEALQEFSRFCARRLRPHIRAATLTHTWQDWYVLINMKKVLRCSHPPPPHPPQVSAAWQLLGDNNAARASAEAYGTFIRTLTHPRETMPWYHASTQVIDPDHAGWGDPAECLLHYTAVKMVTWARWISSPPKNDYIRANWWVVWCRYGWMTGTHNGGQILYEFAVVEALNDCEIPCQINLLPGEPLCDQSCVKNH